METTKTEHWNQSNNEIPVFKVDPILVLILGFITGLYHIYWNIKVAEVLNAVAEKEVISSPIAIFRLLFSNKYLFLLFGR
jgi:hypothetical protein